MPRLLLLVWTLLAGTAIAQSAAPTRPALDQLFEDYFERSLLLNPLNATFIGDHRYDDRLTNTISPVRLA